MRELKFYTPDDIPSEILVFDRDVEQLGVGKSGKIGFLSITIEDRDSKSVITEIESQAPLHLQKALYCEESFQKMAFLYVVSSSGGILQGDRYRIDISLKENTCAHVTTQGATRIYGMNSNSAIQMVTLNLAKNSYLEFLPDQIIPYEKSRFYQKMNLNVQSDSTLVYSEMITPGRTAMGESFSYDLCYLKTKCTDELDNLLFLDVVKMEPKKNSLASFGILGENEVLGTVYIVTKKENIEPIKESIHQIIEESGILGGASILPGDSGIIVRFLGKKTDKIKDVIYKTSGIVRKQVLGAPFSVIRKS
ncbi:urease accessory protein [Nitrosopumilus sp. b1]|uniref:urease accessory protein UreD n=1 Tax=Nitrosopumilus sp. b1 TaxID=2109907 RepID=UPI0015F587A3|nr:urease accessory protein UreD [Nitrosopumilus sp. b1]KAF6243284.1 urease accessory protein [Nitrosopumilus sp. b1]